MIVPARSVESWAKRTEEAQIPVLLAWATPAARQATLESAGESAAEEARQRAKGR